MTLTCFRHPDILTYYTSPEWTAHVLFSHIARAVCRLKVSVVEAPLNYEDVGRNSYSHSARDRRPRRQPPVSRCKYEVSQFSRTDQSLSLIFWILQFPILMCVVTLFCRPCLNGDTGPMSDATSSVSSGLCSSN